MLVYLCWLFIYRTPVGFWMRAAGEHPQSLRSAGKSPEKMKYLASVLCGIFSGLGGAHLSLGYLTMFSENMSASRGYIAVACVIFGRSNPPMVFLAALVFGFIDAMGMRLQSVGFPSSLTSTFPMWARCCSWCWWCGTRGRRKNAWPATWPRSGNGVHPRGFPRKNGLS